MTPSFLRLLLVNALFLMCFFSCAPGDEDNSLSVDTYIDMGMPDPAKKWDMPDYTQAYNVLARIKWEQPLQLPAKDSKKSGPLFERMVSMDYLSFLQDSTRSLNEKAGLISEFTRVYDYWIDIYTNPTLKRNYYHREIIDIQMFNLRLTESMVDLAHKIDRSDNPADIGLRYGYSAIKENYLTCLNTDLKTQSYTSEFLDHDLERMADSIFSSVMRNKEWMDSSAVRRLKLSLRLVMDSTSSASIRKKYESLERSLSL